MNMSKHHFAIYLTAAALALSLVACGKKGGAPAASQVAVKVGSEEISVHQINQVLARSNTANASPEAIKALTREVLEKLIDQQLAVDQATDKDLHRSPEVVAQIEAARRDILARAYLQQVASAVPKPSADETSKYFTDHPQLFAQRRIFNLQEIVVPVQSGALAQLRNAASANASAEEVANTLKAAGIKFGGGNVTRAAEQVPLELLPKVHALKDGQSLLIENPQNLTYLRLVSSQQAPVDQATAVPRIEQFLTNQRVNQAIAANLKQLRATTTISYQGEFSAPAPTAAASDAAPAATDNQSAIDKGIAGLKKAF